MISYLTKQIEFENWANSEILSSMKQIPMNELSPKALNLFSHNLSVNSIWLSRLFSETPTTTLFQERSLDECETTLNEIKQKWKKYISGINENELNRKIEFIFPFDGTKKRMSVLDAITHILHHSSYHRGQIVTSLKGSIEPLPFVTYIKFAFEDVE